MISQLELKIEKYKLILKEVGSETKDNWWTIAIDRKLHNQGVTYQMHPTRQAKIKSPFFEETKDYFQKLKSSPEGLTLEKVGAFRILYRSQTKFHPKVGEHRPIGALPSLFFKFKPELREKIDGLFIDTLAEQVHQKEGLLDISKETMRSTNVKKKLNY